MSIPRDNILLRKLPQPKLVKLPNGLTFYARYQRVPRHKVRVKRTYKRKIGPRRERKQRAPRRAQQSGSGYVNQYVNAGNLMRGVNLVKRGANNDLGKMIIDDAVGFIPTAYYNSIER